jgi:hypothetical protein
MKRVLKPISPDIKEYISGVQAFVEADTFSKHELWRRFAQQARFLDPNSSTVQFDWHDTGSGYFAQIGTFADEPVMISILTAMINNRKILFYYGSSRVVDYDLIEMWIKENLPESAKCPGQPRGHRYSDATNFINVIG